MIRFFYEAVKKQKEQQKPYWKLTYKINKLLVNLFYPVSQRWKKEMGIEEGSPVIVSLTTYPARIKSVWITIASLLQQTMKPSKVILWLAQEQFPTSEIPKSLKRLQKRGLEIRFGEDLKPHKKYYYTLQEYTEHYVITADDDVLYPENFIEQLWRGHEKYPDTIICSWSHKIEFDAQGRFIPYNDWLDNREEKPSYTTLAVGCNGVLYPPNCLSQEAFEQQKIMENSLYTDDLWLKCMEILNEYKTVNCCKEILIYFNRLATMHSGLWKKNIGESRNNDIIWKQLMDQYPQVKKRLVQEKNNG